VESDGEIALIETGPGSTLPTCLRALADHGVLPGQIRKIFVTHIHLDHAGAAGWWAQQGATVYCHPAAARHLIDPSRLMDSARLVYGEDGLRSLWGEMLPAPAERVCALNDGESVALGSVQMTAWDTPGHARHHHAFHTQGVCFTGDVAGVRLENCGYTSVAAAPPQFDAAAYVASVKRLQSGGFDELYLTHFGSVRDVGSHLENYALRIGEVADRMADWLGEAPPGDAEDWHTQLRHRYHDAEFASAKSATISDELWAKYELANGTGMCADGVRLSLEK
ncbi:MAG: MBL fold metallo-hydrolase, partial [Verrucomicrobiales bacterium]|nr:MBL fold metallo-hydrolase [Verrucomicrobiales bacterium]